MEITLLGSIFLFISIICLFFKIHYYIYILLYFCIFQACAVFNIGNKGIGFQLIGEIILIMRYYIPLILTKKYFLKIPNNNIIKALIIFIILVFFTTLLCPILFSGIRVYGTRSIDSDVATNGIPLLFRFSKIISVLILYLHVFTIIIIYKNRKHFTYIGIKKLLITLSVTAVFIGFWEYFAKLGFTYFPEDIFFNFKGASLQHKQIAFANIMRLNSTFMEPSFAGSFLAASFWSIFPFKQKKTYLISFFLIIALILNLSGTGVATFIVGGIFYLILSQRIKQLLYICLICILIYIILIYSGFIELFEYMIITKADGQSGSTRIESIIFSWKLFIETFGLGVGYGYHRGGSIITNILSETGIIASLIFIKWILIDIIGSLYQQYNHKKEEIITSILLYTTCVFCSQCFAIPDINFVPFWIGIYISCIVIFNCKLSFKV